MWSWIDRRGCGVGVAVLAAGAFSASVDASTFGPLITSGFDLNAPSTPVDVRYDSAFGHWHLQADLIFAPGAGPMTKAFESPFGHTGGPILLDAQQPFPQPLWEDFFLVPGPIPGGPPGSEPVSDWHEEILTPGWEWVIPEDPRLGVTLPNPFQPNESLITKNGDPWPWMPQPHPGGPDPTKIWVEFPPIDPGNVLDIHKALLWVGTPGNRVWGDYVLDDGTSFDESAILVLEYPTPEPGTASLLALAGLTLLRRRK